MTRTGAAVEIVDVRKTGDWYVIRGYVDGTEASVDVPAPYVEGLPRKEAYALFSCGLFRIVSERLV